jgi:hypothetical protein
MMKLMAGPKILCNRRVSSRGCDKLALMSRGREGGAEELVKSPQTKLVPLEFSEAGTVADTMAFLLTKEAARGALTHGIQEDGITFVIT